jgi:hypothetical protein
MYPRASTSAFAAENILQNVLGYICIQPPTPEPWLLGTQRPQPPSEAEQDMSQPSVSG